MTYPFDNRRSRRGSSQSVPLETARKIARQRDQLVEKVEQLRRENDKLAESRQKALQQKESLEQETSQLAEQLAEADEEIERLAARLQQADQPDRPDQPDKAEQTEPAAQAQEEGEIVDRLTRRVASLTDDLERVRRRSGETAREARRAERMRLLAGLGDVLDSVERGLAMQPEGAGRQGLEAIHSQILDFLRREGAELTGQVGAKMDPKIHEAVEVVETPDFQSGQIVEVARRGVRLEDGTVVMPAKVQVAA
jgi:molecular chaperone GrpE